MRVAYLLRGLVAAAGFCSGEALPTEQPVPCTPIEQFTIEWFLENALPRFARPFQDTALFYSRGMSTQAITLARKSGLTTIWDVWPCYLYVHHDVPSNPMRCIHHDAPKRTRFYEAMSKAFAMKAQGYVTVMHDKGDYENPPMDGIWGRIEFPTMKALGHVREMAKVDGIVSRFKVFWKFGLDLSNVGAEDMKKWPSAWLSLVKQGWMKMELKRDLYPGNSGEKCLMPSEYAFFDNVDW